MTTISQQIRFDCLKLAIGVACMPTAKAAPRGDDIVRCARIFENFMKGKLPATETFVE